MSLFNNNHKYGSPAFSLDAGGCVIHCDLELKECYTRVEDLFPTPVTCHVCYLRYNYDLARNKLTWK